MTRSAGKPMLEKVDTLVKFDRPRAPMVTSVLWWIGSFISISALAVLQIYLK